jgi:ribosomal protein L7Ae-like RNA K-turn-binding protein
MTAWRRNWKMKQSQETKSKIGLISMCRRAGKLVMGMDMVKDACAAGTAKAVFAAKDFSPKSLKEVKFSCARYGIEIYSLDMTMDEIGDGLGKRTGVVAMTDAGFAKSCKKGLVQIEIDENEFYGKV